MVSLLLVLSTTSQHPQYATKGKPLIIFQYLIHDLLFCINISFNEQIPSMFNAFKTAEHKKKFDLIVVSIMQLCQDFENKNKSCFILLLQINYEI